MSLTVDRHHRQRQHDVRCSDDELSCKICLSAYNQRSSGQRPRTLHCQHTFCESCLLQLVTSGRRQRKVPFGFHSGPEGQSADIVKCPLCKYRTYLGPSSIQGLPLNSTAIKHSSQKSGLHDGYGLQPHDLKAPCASRGVKTKGKGNSMVHFMSSGTTGNRVMAQRFENFHPPPQDEDIWAMLSHRRQLRFDDDDPSASTLDHGVGFVPRHDTWDESDGVFEDVTPSAVLVGQFGQETHAGQPGSLHSPSSINCAADGRLVVVDADSVQILHSNGAYVSSFRMVGARAACFIKDDGGGESLVVATGSGISICDRTGRVDKHLPVGADVLAVAALRHGAGVFVAAHSNRLTICSRYKPSAVLRSISSVRPLNAPIGHPGMAFSDIVAVATTATSQLYVVDSAAVLSVDADTATLLYSISTTETRLLRQPSAVTVNLATGSMLVCDATTRRVMQFDAEGRLQRCVVQLENDDNQCVALATGPPQGSDGRQLFYVMCRGPGFAEVRMYQT